jgi:hypothetical protein
MSPAERAAAAHAAAEAADHPRDKAALLGAARAWERIAGPGAQWSLRGEQRALRRLRIDVAVAAGPFQKPAPPKAPPPAKEPRIVKSELVEARIEF